VAEDGTAFPPSFSIQHSALSTQHSAFSIEHSAVRQKQQQTGAWPTVILFPCTTPMLGVAHALKLHRTGCATRPDGFAGAVQGLMWMDRGDCCRSHQLLIGGASPAIFAGLIRELSADAYFVLDLLFGQDRGEFLHLEDLADFDFGVAGVAVGATLDPLDGLFEGLDLQHPEAGDELLGLRERAVDDGARLAGNLTRAPLELGWRPSRASRTPAFMSSPLYLPISAMSCGSGRAPSFSDSAVALTMTMNRIAGSPLVERWLRGLFSSLAICWLTGELRSRAQLDRCCSLS
jgi:hypothetical protein